MKVEEGVKWDGCDEKEGGVKEKVDVLGKRKKKGS